MPLGVLGGTLLATALKAIFDIGSTVAQNKYNSPRAMRNRLKQAGLPLAYMYRGNVATQNSAPQLSIDPNLGTVETEKVKASKLAREALLKDILQRIHQFFAKLFEILHMRSRVYWPFLAMIRII